MISGWGSSFSAAWASDAELLYLHEGMKGDFFKSGRKEGKRGTGARVVATARPRRNLADGAKMRGRRSILERDAARNYQLAGMQHVLSGSRRAKWINLGPTFGENDLVFNQPRCIADLEPLRAAATERGAGINSKPIQALNRMGWMGVGGRRRASRPPLAWGTADQPRSIV